MVPESNERQRRIRPIILAGGLGTRMLPRTNVLPKPLLPVARKPLLAHVLDFVEAANKHRPAVVVGHMSSLIESYFVHDSVDFVHNSEGSMAEGLLKAAELDTTFDAFWCLSSDVLVPPEICNDALAEAEVVDSSILVLSQLINPGYKKWEYLVNGGHLSDIRVSENNVSVERAALIVTKSDLAVFEHVVGRPVVPFPVNHEFYGFQSGWVLLLKVLAAKQARIRVSVTDLEVVNYNREADLLTVPTWL